MELLPSQEINSFSSFTLTEAQLVQAVESITPETQLWLQNFLSESNHARLENRYDPEAPLRFLQEEAYRKGQADMVETILAAIPVPHRILINNSLQEN